MARCLILLHDQDVDGSVHSSLYLEKSLPLSSIRSSWNRLIRNNRISLIEYLENSRGGGTMLHTFIFLSKEGWFYVGALIWSVAKLSSELWPLLPNKKLDLVTTKLVDRSRGGLQKEQVEQLLEDKCFTQFCIELSSKGHQQEMWEFMGKTGYRRMAHFSALSCKGYYNMRADDVSVNYHRRNSDHEIEDVLSMEQQFRTLFNTWMLLVIRIWQDVRERPYRGTGDESDSDEGSEIISWLKEYWETTIGDGGEGRDDIDNGPPLQETHENYSKTMMLLLPPSANAIPRFGRMPVLATFPSYHSIMSNLAPETLSDIFLVAHSQTQSGERALLSLRTTWVCRYWRTTALNHSPLWADITISRVDSLTHFITRSKNAKLTIALIDINIPESSVLWSAVLGSIQRVTHLTLCPTRRTTRPDDLISLAGSLESDDSDTQTLALETLRLYHVDFRDLQFTFNPIHTLILNECSFFWGRSIGMSSTLTTLRIASPISLVAYTDILLQLQNLRCIKNVRLFNALTSPSQNTPTIQQPIILPTLRVLVLSEGERSSMEAVLQMVQLLDLTGIRRLQFWTTVEATDLIPQLLHAAQTACHHFVITYASILSHSDSWSQISIANDQNPYDSSITLRIEDDPQPSVFTIAMDHLMLDQVEYFHIGYYEQHISTNRCIEAVGGPNSHVSTLVLQHDAVDDFPDFVQDQFPQLDELVFYAESESTEKIAIPMHLIQSGQQYTQLRRVVFCSCNEDSEWDRSEEAIELLEQTGCVIRFEDWRYIVEYYEE
ncbi:hypothetical protein BDN72DRAFT_864717 [Pluteus cervinus]|uniref:Uncharacterized protein n=1 Tax=Pluteus cervinus TaxID=181527 RepID=A0ACD3A2N8_9AGAR|nr:hypothetical protein BDN72DRAFT_864717 [Pluteus cervinus]